MWYVLAVRVQYYLTGLLHIVHRVCFYEETCCTLHLLTLLLLVWHSTTRDA